VNVWALVGVKKYDGSKEVKLYSLDRFHFEFRLPQDSHRSGKVMDQKMVFLPFERDLFLSDFYATGLKTEVTFVSLVNTCEPRTTTRNSNNQAVSFSSLSDDVRPEVM